MALYLEEEDEEEEEEEEEEEGDGDENDNTLPRRRPPIHTSRPYEKPRLDLIERGYGSNGKALRERTLKEKLEEAGYKVDVFSSSVLQLVTAILQKEPVEGVNLAEKIQHPTYRFYTSADRDLSLGISHAFASVIQEARTLKGLDISQNAVRQLQENADEFARRTRDVIEAIKKEENISTYRETVEALNRRQIPTHRGGKWHLRTLQDLYKRCQKFSIDAEPK